MKNSQHKHNASSRRQPKKRPVTKFPAPHSRSEHCNNCTTQSQNLELRLRCLNDAETIEMYSAQDTQNRRYIRLLWERNDLLESILASNGCDFPPCLIDGDDYKKPCTADSGNTDQGTQTSDISNLSADYTAEFCDKDCDRCEDVFQCYKLIDSLVRDILALEEEMVNWRHALVRHLDPIDAQNLQADIFDGLAQRYYESETYQDYLDMFHYAEDPMESREHVQKLWRLAYGTDEGSANL